MSPNQFATTSPTHGRRMVLTFSTALFLLSSSVLAGPGDDEFPPFVQVADGYERIVSTTEDETPMYNVWIRRKDQQLLAELPADFESKRFFVVPTVAGGDQEMGVYSIWHYLVGRESQFVYWKRYDDKLALMEPNLQFRSSGDAESKTATERVYTDRVILSTPIVCFGPNDGPVIDLDQILMQQSGEFFGWFTAGADWSLSRITSAKAFPLNLEFSIEFPRAGGQLATIHYSIGTPPQSPGYQPRDADRRVGFYYVDYTDRAKNDGESQKRRYISRWHLEKRDPDLKLSPPLKPIVYYIEHTTPVRYRRWVRDGILAWNRAFQQIGIEGAIEVRQQDAQTGAHMDKDPEDIRYSFVRWTNSHMGFAIGPVHMHPDTGEIYEADIVMDEGFLASWISQFKSAQLASAAMSGFDQETVDWLAQNPTWDPRYLLAEPANRQRVLEFQRQSLVGTPSEQMTDVPPTMLPFVWSSPNAEIANQGTMCTCLRGYAINVDSIRTALDVGLLDPITYAQDDRGENKGEQSDESILDGLPESFVGPLLKDVIMHEVGHTMGLMHNWEGSAAYSFEQINSEDFKGKRPILATVMDYAPSNIIVENGRLKQGDLACIDIGPYDMWAIKWGYTTGDPSEIVKDAAKTEYAFSSEEGSAGPDPHAKTWDLGENSLDFADAEMRFVKHVRDRIIDKVVKDGEPWEKAREAYISSLYRQIRAVSVASNWVGGAYFNKLHKGDPNAPDPIRPVEVDRQRRALEFMFANSFHDEAYGLTPELLSKLGTQQWPDENWDDPQDWPIHDQILGIQGSAMTMILNPTTLRRIMDNEMRTPAGDDALTVPEVLKKVRAEVWNGIDRSDRKFTEREPMISSLRRNLQREHIDRLILISNGAYWPGATENTIRTLARQELREILTWISDAPVNRADMYSKAHLADAKERITKALDAAYIRNN